MILQFTDSDKCCHPYVTLQHSDYNFKFNAQDTDLRAMVPVIAPHYSELRRLGITY